MYNCLPINLQFPSHWSISNPDMSRSTTSMAIIWLEFCFLSVPYNNIHLLLMKKTVVSVKSVNIVDMPFYLTMYNNTYLQKLINGCSVWQKPWMIFTQIIWMCPPTFKWISWWRAAVFWHELSWWHWKWMDSKKVENLLMFTTIELAIKMWHFL